jgi:tripartite-type tricarboxylate transporter receptor subunit TctC
MRFRNLSSGGVTASILAFAAAAALVSPSWAAYPERPLRIISPFPPGSVTDTLARPLAGKLSESLGQPVVVDNRAGAGGNIAAQIVVGSEPDGYTLLMGTWNTNATNGSLYKNLPYRVLDDFVPVSMTATSYLLLVTHPSLPTRSVQELIALAKARPGKLNFGSGGSGTSPHLAGELFKSMASISMTHIPYKGSPQSTIDLLAGRLDLIFASQATILPHIKAGRVRLLATTNNVRAPEMPEVPTIAEAGVPGYEIKPWYGVFAAAATPHSIVKKLNAEIVRILSAPDVKAAYASRGLIAASSTPEAFKNHVQSEFRKWDKVIKAAGMVAD